LAVERRLSAPFFSFSPFGKLLMDLRFVPLKSLATLVGIERSATLPPARAARMSTVGADVSNIGPCSVALASTWPERHIFSRLKYQPKHHCKLKKILILKYSCENTGAVLETFFGPCRCDAMFRRVQDQSGL
jgi:hypothetical protein